MEGTGEGCELFCSPKSPYLSAMSQQFCGRLQLPIGTISQDETISFVYKITFVDETHLHPGRHYFLTALNKSLRTSRETNFRLIQTFNWSKNNFAEIHMSQGLDWVFPFLSHYGSWYATIALLDTTFGPRFLGFYLAKMLHFWNLSSG